MKTLYDVLGALPEDDAESLRAAFRTAARANHPDANTGDPDAPLRFRRIIRANAILSDKRQRVHYDRLLAIALRERRFNQERRLKFVIAGSILPVALLGGYLLGHVPRASLVAAKAVEVPARETAVAAAVKPKHLSDIVGQSRPREDRHNVEIPSKPRDPEATKEVTVLNATAPVETVSTAAAPVENTESDPAPADVPAVRISGRTMPKAIESGASWRITTVIFTSRSPTSIWRSISIRSFLMHISTVELSSTVWATSIAHSLTLPAPSKSMT